MENRGGARAAAVLAALWTLLAPAWSFAADDPQEPQRPGLLKRAVRSFLSDDEAGGGRGVHLGPFYPRVEIVTSGAGLAPMVHFWAPDIGGTRLDVHASAAYSIYRYQYYDLQVGRVPHVGKRLPRVAWGTRGLFPLADIEKSAEAPGFDIYASAQYRDFPREDFYGIGATSLRLDRTDYRLRDGLYEGIVRYRVERLSFMARAGLLQASIRPGTDSAFPDTGISNDEGTAPGLLRSPDFVEVSGGAWLELRDEPRNPHRGAALGVAFSRFDDRHGNAFEFNRVLVDAREYIPLGSNRHVIALRQVTSLTNRTPAAGCLSTCSRLSVAARSSGDTAPSGSAATSSSPWRGSIVSSSTRRSSWRSSTRPARCSPRCASSISATCFAAGGPGSA